MSRMSYICALPLLASAAMLSAPLARAASAAGLDTNQDGVVSLAEAEYDAKLKLDFKSMDVNEDGRLDSTELPGLSPAMPGTAPLLTESETSGPGTGPTTGTSTNGSASVPGAAAGAVPSGGATGSGVPAGPGIRSPGATVGAPAGRAPAAPSAGASGSGRTGARW